MSSIYKIKIEPLCNHHSLPFAYICITKYCQCQIKLCEKCHTQHETQNQNSNLMKIDNFLEKVGTEVGIINKQQEKLLSLTGKKPTVIVQESKQKVEKFIINQVKVLEDSMKYLNQESHTVRKQIKDSSEVLGTKMTNIEIKRKELPETFCRKIVDDKLIQTMITFYSQTGFGNFRRKLDKTLQFRAILKDFLAYADKYGNKYEQFMRSSSETISSDLSMKSTMRQMIKKNRNMGNEQNMGYLQFKKNSERENRGNQPKRQKRSRTIFGKKGQIS